MTVEDVKNTANLGPQASGCLAKTPPDLDNKSQEIPVAREGNFGCVSNSEKKLTKNFLIIERKRSSGFRCIVHSSFSPISSPCGRSNPAGNYNI